MDVNRTKKYVIKTVYISVYFMVHMFFITKQYVSMRYVRHERKHYFLEYRICYTLNIYIKRVNMYFMYKIKYNICYLYKHSKTVV